MAKTKKPAKDSAQASSNSTSKAAKTTKTKRATKGTRKTTSAVPDSAGQQEVEIDRREPAADRRDDDRRSKQVTVEVERRTSDRRKVQRRRQIDPTTCERDYTDDEIEFMRALDEYKRTSGRMFPTCSEILEVVMKLGYVKQPIPIVEPAETAPAVTTVEETATESFSFGPTGESHLADDF